ncbi:MAG: class I SAM-dependent methyltransferase [Acidobacteria bacterium]|nr:class I SAM-dependent methyltransferase [Acidobacteriota bacterium]
MRRVVEDLGITARTTVLDVGGTPYNWSLAPLCPRVTIVNLARAGAEMGGAAWVIADGRRLPFRDRAFEVVFSNSVIEHLGDERSQAEFAREVARVGRFFYVQTPNRWFPIEHHLLTPFLHFLPAKLAGWLARRFTLWRLLARPSPDRAKYYIEHYLADVRLLDAGGLAKLFPKAIIARERFLGFTKSLAAARRPGR